MSLNQVRSVLQSIAGLLGDVNAATKGRIAQREARGAAGKATGLFS